MSAERDRMLRRIAEALRRAKAPGGTPAPLAGAVGQASPPADKPVDAESLVSRFSEELEALTGRVHVVANVDEAVTTIQAVIAGTDSTRILCWDEAELRQSDLRSRLVNRGVEVLEYRLPFDPDGRRRTLAELDPVQVGLTGAAAGLADTGSIVLTSGPGRGRLVSLLPPVHIALLSRQRLYPSLPAFLEAHPGIVSQGSNLVIVTGPSRTADIEMMLTYGVHGPREVHVILTP